MATTGFMPFPKSYQYAPEPILGAQTFNSLPIEPTWHTLWPVVDAGIDQRLDTRRSKKRSKRRSKAHKKTRKVEIGQYVLQVIGLVSLILAAIKGLESLVGAGFMLVLMGHDRKLKKRVVSSMSATQMLKRAGADCKKDLFKDEDNSTESKKLIKRKRKKTGSRLGREDDLDEDYVFV